jgi:hypothetical protein
MNEKMYSSRNANNNGSGNGTGNNPPPNNSTNGSGNGTGNNPPPNNSTNGSGNGTGNNPPPNNFTNGSGNGTQNNMSNSSVQFTPIISNMTNLTFNSLDDNMTTAVIGNSIWRLNTSSNSFTKYYQSSVNYFPNAQIFTMPNIIVVISSNQTAAQVFAYSDDNDGHLTICLHYEFDSFVNFPQIMISPKFTKVAVMGPILPSNSTNTANSQPHIDAFHINYTSNSFLNISFPIQTVINPQSTFIALS